jgi:kanamycin nucleotidyltransferase
MAKSEKVKIAEIISEMILQKYGDEILLVGVYGSVATGEDTDYSDIDMYVVTKNLTSQKYFAYKGVPVTIHYKTEKEVLEAIRNVTSTWPAEVHQFLAPKILYGSKRLLNKWKRVAKRIPEEDFRKAASTALIEIYENVGKVRNACMQRNLGRCIEAVWNVVWHADMFVALVNKTYYKKPGFRGLEEAMNLQKIPTNYDKLMKTLWESRAFKELNKASTELWENCLELAREEGIRFENYTSIREIKI